MSYFTSRILRIPETLCIISECWSKAEENLRDDIRENYPDIDEECITQLFHRKFVKELRLKSEENAIAKAFLNDLKKHFPLLQHRIEILKKFDGLIADVTLHNRRTEGKTGGDFGFEIIRPQVKYCSSEIKNSLKISDYPRGILCQAKLKKANGKWGVFTRKQKSVLPERLKYVTLLLYRYEDNEGHFLKPFKWQRCDFPSLSFEQIKEWLKKDSFPSLEDSGGIIKQLGNRDIGTDDANELKEIISPKNNRSLIVRIYWPDDKHPGSEVLITRRTQIKPQVSATVRQ